jgi:hypothetical protein
MITLEEFKALSDNLIDPPVYHKHYDTLFYVMVEIDEDFLGGSFKTNDGRFWGYIEIIDCRKSPHLQNVDRIKPDDTILSKCNHFPNQNWGMDVPTIEYPFKVIINGNDDCSYSKFFDTEEKAMSFLNNLDEPLSMEFIQTEMAFTN